MAASTSTAASAASPAAAAACSMQSVLVYAGDGVAAGPLRQTLHALRRLLSHRYDVKAVEQHTLADHPWTDSTALLVLPGGRDVPYQNHLAGKACRRIRQYIEGGGAYLGLCAGAYFGSHRVVFEPGTRLEVMGPRELAFFAGTATGSVFPGFQYDLESGARAAAIRIDTAALVDVHQAELVTYFNGGCRFDLDTPTDLVRPLAWYTEAPAADTVAILECRVGKGVAILSGVHAEYDPELLDTSLPAHAALQPQLRTTEPARAALFRSLLRRLGLKTVDVVREPPPVTHLALVTAGLAPTHPYSAEIVSLFSEAVVGVPALETGDASAPVALPALALETPRFIAVDPPGGPLAVVVCEQLPRDAPGTTFDSRLYLERLRHHHGGSLLSQDALEETPTLTAHTAVWGATVLYAEVITSTQTLLDRNMALTSKLPSGLVCLAAQQVSGRGRGGNVWVSSPGCLQFSVALRHRSGTTVVFLQYLMALAVVHAVRSLRPGYNDLGLRIKWPNDIYSVDEDRSAPSGRTLRKIGGVLVNSNHLKGEFVLVVGCGVNVSNSEPTDCINDVIARHNARTGAALALVRKEELLAATMATFEDLHRTMERANSFSPLTSLYYRYWLHTGETVTLQDHGGVTATIEGISDQGFLRTRSTQPPHDRYEHQPDGNSFDIMKNMIARKVT